jgi:hypothetical protein
MRNRNATTPTSLTAVGGDSSRRLHDGRTPSAAEVASYRRQDRRGVVLVVIIVCLTVAAAIFVSVVRQVAAERQALEGSQRLLQAQWLAEAGIERAAARLAADPKYAGETWTIPAAELAATEGAVVRILIAAVADRPEQRSVRVEADSSDNPEHRCRHVKQIIVDRDAMTSRLRAKTPK